MPRQFQIIFSLAKRNLVSLFDDIGFPLLLVNKSCYGIVVPEENALIVAGNHGDNHGVHDLPDRRGEKFCQRVIKYRSVASAVYQPPDQKKQSVKNRPG